MQRATKNPIACRAKRESLSPAVRGYGKGLWLLLLAGTMVLSACGSGNSNRVTVIPVTLSGNWQFTMAAPADGSFTGGLQGGFLLQSGSSATGSIAYSVSLPTSPSVALCNSGSAAITGTINGVTGEQSVALTASAGTQTFTLTGTLSFDGSTMGGTYNSTAGTAANGTACGTVQTGLQWSAILVPPLMGTIQGSFHSAGGTAGLDDQDFLVLGALTQDANTGTDSARVTGTLSFLNPLTNLSDYPCLGNASVKGQISGNYVFLQIIGGDGSNSGQIGRSPGSGLQPVTFDSVQNAYVLHSLAGAGYAVYASACGGGSLQSPADSGNICLAVNSTAACQLPVTLSPSALVFPVQPVGSPPALQTITLANTYGSSLVGLTLTLANNSGTNNFAETDACLGGAPSQGQPFNLDPKQSCVITIAFAPLQNCAAGTLPDECLTASLIVTSPNNDAIFTLPITGGVSSAAAAAGELPQRVPNSRAHSFRAAEHHAEID
jgi:hypothetical protein